MGRKPQNLTPLSPEYAAYLDSPQWQARRELVLARDDYTCQRCGQKPKRLEVHHQHYGHVFHEEPQDLITLCGRCHAQLEGRPVKRRGGFRLFFLPRKKMGNKAIP